MLRVLSIFFCLVMMVSCTKHEKESLISNEEGVSWVGITDCNEKSHTYSYGYGFTFFSSGKFYEFFYDYETSRRMPVYFQCMDCGYPQTINEALVNWKLEEDTLKLSKYRFNLGIYTAIVVRNIKEDSLFLSEIRGKNKLECKYIMTKLKNSILDTFCTDNILHPRG